MKKFIGRQGDVIFIQVEDDGLEFELEQIDPRGLVLAEGETSGHYHAVFGPKVLLGRSERGGTARPLVIGRGGAEVRVVGGGAGGVDRHTPITLKPGKYEVRIQRSWSSAYSRKVED